MDDKKPVNRYSMAFKMRVVDDVENGLLNAEEARKLYGIGGRNTVHEWIAQYGKNLRMGRKVYIMTKEEETELLLLKRENEKLRKMLENSMLKELTYESLLEEIEEEYGIEAKKNLSSKLLKESRERLKNLLDDPTSR
ncbi:MAG: transposase [Candidatus Cloacimonetes bacterium]|jgi:transposase-like protein|nr:transposase [Candidatus Cloacimonadota bacterium]